MSHAAPVGPPIHPAALRHGGGLAQAARAWPDAPGPWLDLSTGINPRPWTGARAAEADLAHLPDPGRLAALEVVAARAFGVADPARVAATAGAEAGLRLLPLLLKARGVDVVGPTYGGHAEAWVSAGVPARLIDRDEAAGSSAEVLVAVNPNNPDGGVLTPPALEAIARRRAAEGRWLVVDESFVETRPSLSVAGLASSGLAGPGLIVLRSFGKFYGLAGLRLGFVIGPPAVIAALRLRQGDWPVSAEALVMGTAAYADEAWRAAALARLEADAARLDAMLVRAGFSIVGGTALFRLAASPDAHRWFQRLGRAGVLTRPFDHSPHWLRFGLPDTAGFSRLERLLEGGL